MSISDDLKRERLKNSLGLKVDQYKQVGAALLSTMNPADEPKLQHQLEQLEADMQRIEKELHFLETPQTPTPEVAQEQATRALERGQADAQSAVRQPRKIGRIINSLPFRYDGTTAFYDRAKEQADIQRYIQDGARLITIHARVGAGKTALVSKVLGELEHKADLVTGIVALSAGQFHKQVSLDVILDDFQQLLPDGALTYKPGDPASEKVTALLHALREGRYVLLLDNLEALLDENDALRDADLQALLIAVLECGGLTVLVTTRQRPQLPNLLRVHERLVPLELGLPTEEALLMLRDLDRNGRLPAEDTLLTQLIERVSGLPRALEAVVGLLETDSILTLAELLQDNALFEGEVTQHIVEKALSTLPPLLIRVMEALALLGQPVSLAAIEYILAPHVDWTGKKLRDVLNRLIDWCFVSYNTANQRFSIHRLEREYCEKHIPLGTPADSAAEPPLYTRYALNARAAKFFESQRKPKAEWKTLADLEPQLSEFEYRIRLEDYDTAASLLFDFDFDCLLLWGHAKLMVTLHERLLGNIKDRLAQSIHLGNLGLAYSELGDLRKAIEYYEQALAIAREIGDKGSEGTWLGNLGLNYHDLGKVDQAIAYYEQSLVIRREMGDTGGESRDLNNLGIGYSTLGKVGKAIEYYEQSLVISREIRDKRSEGSNLGNLGLAYSELGELRKAIEYYEQSLVINREIRNKGGEGNTLGNLGNAYSELAEAGKAIEYYEQSLAIFREIGNKSGECNDLENLANVLIEQGDFDTGFAHLNLSLQIAKDIPSPRQQSYTGTSLSCAHLWQGDLVAAQQAIETARRHDAPENNHTAAVLHGVIMLRLGNVEAAQTAFHAAVGLTDALLKQPQAAYNVRYARGLARTSLALITNGALDDAQADYEAALAQSNAKGVVQKELRLLEELAKTPNGERLAPLLALLRAKL